MSEADGARKSKREMNCERMPYNTVWAVIQVITVGNIPSLIFQVFKHFSVVDCIIRYASSDMRSHLVSSIKRYPVFLRQNGEIPFWKGMYIYQSEQND